MQFFDDAIEQEKTTRALYLDLARRSAANGLKKIFTVLAAQEESHIRGFEHLKAGEGAKLSNQRFADEVKHILKDPKDAVKAFNYDIALVPLYRKAQELEMESRQLYLGQAQDPALAAHKGFFEELAAEERDHYDVIERVVKFIRRPDHWVGNPEFHQMDGF